MHNIKIANMSPATAMAPPHERKNIYITMVIGLTFLFFISRSLLAYAVMVSRNIGKKWWQPIVIGLAVEVTSEMIMFAVESWVPLFITLMIFSHAACTAAVVWKNHKMTVPRVRLTLERTIEDIAPYVSLLDSEEKEYQELHEKDTELLLPPIK